MLAAGARRRACASARAAVTRGLSWAWLHSAAGMRIEKVKLHAPNTYYPAGRGYPASAGAEGTGDGRRRVSSVSYRRTGMHSDGSAEMEAGEDLLKVMHVLQLDSVPVARDAAAASGEPGRGKERGSGAEGPQAAGTPGEADQLQTGVFLCACVWTHSRI